MLDALTGLAGLVVPPLFDFVKRKFIKTNTNTNPQAILAQVVQTKPEFVPNYIEAQAKLVEAEVKRFNRDITQPVSVWVANLRAVIRPLFTLIAIALICVITVLQINIDPAIRRLFELTISSWFGSRLLVG